MRANARSLVLGVLAISVSTAVAAATISSPYRQARPGSLAAKRAAPGEQRLELDRAALAALRSSGAGPVEVTGFPTGPGTTSRVVLRRFEIVSPEARIRVTGPDGDSFRAFPSIVHFSGRIPGEPDSMVYVSAHEDKLVALVSSSAGLTYVGPDESKSGFVVRDSSSPANDDYTATPWTCQAELLPEFPNAPAPAAKPVATAPTLVGFQKGTLIVETDQELLAKFAGDADAMTSYLVTLFGAFNLIYQRDLALHLSVIEIHVWTVPDPWNGPSTLDQLYQLGDWYHANRPLGTFPRTTVHLTSGLADTGGLAWRPALCTDDGMVSGHWAGAYGLSQIHADYPATAFDLIVPTHEVGHNSGSAHTHCYVPEIDQCFNMEAGCYGGATSLPPGGGTLMSYCHTLPGGIDNVNLLFHARCVNEQMLPYIQGRTCMTAVASFPDVPTTHPLFHYVETIFQLGITGGCAGGNYCPNNPVTRAQMAVFLLKAKFGASHVPPNCAGIFDDVPCPSTFANWIEELAGLGITGGCGGSNYCPNNTVTRKQMAPFLLKTLNGSGYVPPDCTGIFDDVTCPSTFANWIERIYALGITGGCQTSPLRYCPDNPNTRGQMAVFLVKTFNLTW
jgi:Metallo-peptidase family M12/S-layer homology domain